MNQESLEALAQEMYAEIEDRKDSKMGSVVTQGLTALYGPPMLNPDLFLVTFQGGAEDPLIQNTWPKQLLYLHDDFKFGTALRKYSQEVGLFDSLKNSTVAMASCFPQAPTSEAGKWMEDQGHHGSWRMFSVKWVRRMVSAMCPRVVVVFGNKASKALGVENGWRDEQFRKTNNWRTYGRSEIEGSPAIYCLHLSQGFDRVSVRNSLRAAKEVIDSS